MCEGAELGDGVSAATAIPRLPLPAEAAPLTLHCNAELGIPGSRHLSSVCGSYIFTSAPGDVSYSGRVAKLGLCKKPRKGLKCCQKLVYLE